MKQKFFDSASVYFQSLVQDVRQYCCICIRNRIFVDYMECFHYITKSMEFKNLGCPRYIIYWFLVTNIDLINMIIKYDRNIIAIQNEMFSWLTNHKTATCSTFQQYYIGLTSNLSSKYENDIIHELFFEDIELPSEMAYFPSLYSWIIFLSLYCLWNRLDDSHLSLKQEKLHYKYIAKFIMKGMNEVDNDILHDESICVALYFLSEKKKKRQTASYSVQTIMLNNFHDFRVNSIKDQIVIVQFYDPWYIENNFQI